MIPESVLMAHGYNGKLELNEKTITIRRERRWSRATGYSTIHDKDILISEITSVKLMKLAVTSGSLQFIVSGILESRDENTVLFEPAHTREFEVFKDEVEKRIAVINKM